MATAARSQHLLHLEAHQLLTVHLDLLAHAVVCGHVVGRLVQGKELLRLYLASSGRWLIIYKKYLKKSWFRAQQVRVCLKKQHTASVSSPFSSQTPRLEPASAGTRTNFMRRCRASSTFKRKVKVMDLGWDVPPPYTNSPRKTL